MPYLNWFLGAKNDRDVFPNMVEGFVRWGGSYLLYPWMTNTISQLFHFDQAFLDSYVPGLATSQYSKLLHGLRFALKHMIDDEKFEPGDTSPFWCIEILPLQDFINRVSGQNENLAYLSSKTRRVLLPKLIFSSKKNEYFQELNPDLKFNLEGSEILKQPRWVLRLKRIWNILFLVEEIFQIMEKNPKELLYPENLQQFNEAYQLLFELDIDLIGLIEKIIEIGCYLEQKYIRNFAKDNHDLSKFFQDIGYYLGLITSKMGYSQGFVDFSLQAKQLSPQILSWLTNIMNELVQFISTKSKIVVQSQRLEKLKHEIQNFEKKPQFLEKNSLEIFFELLQFIHKPSRNKVIKLIRQVAIEHEALILEVLSLLKYEVIPYGLGIIEGLENELMLEPGSLLGPLEIFCQHSYQSFIEFLDFRHQNDLKYLYSQNWFIVREENAYHQLSKLKFQLDQLNLLINYLEIDKPSIQKFKFFYEYLFEVDSLHAEELRNHFDEQMWNESQDTIKSVLFSHLAQVKNQIFSLCQYLEKNRFVKHHSVAYFELKSQFKISYHDLTDEQKSYCQRFTNQSEKMHEIQRFILQIKEDELQKRLRQPESKALWISSTILVLFQDEHYLIEIENQDIVNIERKPDLNLGFQPKINKPVFLSGYMIEKLGIVPRGDVSLYEDVPRWSIEVNYFFKPVVTPIIIKDLTVEEAVSYFQDLFVQLTKIAKMRSIIMELISSIQLNKLPTKLMKSSYAELRGLFKALFPVDFEKYDHEFLTQMKSSSKWMSFLRRMEEKLASYLIIKQELLEEVWTHYERVFFQEKINRTLSPNLRAGYLIQSSRYSSSLNHWLHQYHDMIHLHASPALMTQLGSFNPDSAIDISYWNQFTDSTKVVVYVHNALYYLKNFYIGVEKLKKYSQGSSVAKRELGHRIMTIVDYFTFQNFVLFSFPFHQVDLKTLISQVDISTKLYGIFQRYSEIFNLKEKSEYAFLNSSIISEYISLHLFENQSIRAYLIEGQYGPVVEKLAYRLADAKRLLGVFKRVKNYQFFREFRYDVLFNRLKYLKYQRSLEEIGQMIEHHNKPKNKVQYVVYHSYLQQLQSFLTQRINKFHQFLQKRDEIFFKILEKNIQNLIHELDPLEQILSSVFFDRPLNQQQLKMIQSIRDKEQAFLQAKRKIAQNEVDIKKLMTEWKITLEQFEAIQLKKIESDPVNQGLLVLIKKIIEQAEYEIQPRLEPHEKLLLEMMLSDKINSHPALKVLIKRLICFKNNQFCFSPLVFTVKDRMIKKILQRYFHKKTSRMNVREIEYLNKFRDDPAFMLLLKYQDGRFLFKNDELSVIEQWLLEYAQHQYPPLNPLILKSAMELPLTDFYSLWPIQSLLMRADMYRAIRVCHQEKNEMTYKNLEIMFQIQGLNCLKSLELLKFRAQYLREAHQQSRKMMKNYAYIDQKKFLYQLRYLTFSPMFLEYLRKGFSVFRDQCIENISLISPKLSSPLLIHVDWFEMYFNLRPGLLSQHIEKYLNDFCQSFAHQISVSPLNVPLLIQDRKPVLDTRMESLQRVFGGDIWSAHQKAMMSYLQLQYQTIELDKFIYERLIEYTRLFSNILEQRYAILSHPLFLKKKKVFEFLKAYMDVNIQPIEKKGYLTKELYREFIPQIKAGTHDPYFQVFCYKTFENYLKAHLHEFKQLNDLAMILDAFDEYLCDTKKRLLFLEKQYQAKSQNWSEWVYKFLLILPQYYWMTIINYRFHNLKLIEEKQKQIAILKTAIHHSEIQDIHQIVVHFQVFFQQTHIQNTLEKRAIPSWHLLYFFMQIGTYIVDCFYALARLFFPQNHQLHLTSEESYIHQIHQTLEIKAKDVSFDYQNAVALLFKPKSELSFFEAHMLRKA